MRDQAGVIWQCRYVRPLGDFHEDVEVIGHDAVGDDAQPAEAFVEAHVFDQLVLLFLAQDEVAVHHARDAVIVRSDSTQRGGKREL
jgi:hypothetical protein